MKRIFDLNSKRQKIFFLRLCLFTLVVLYGSSLAGDFVLDDRGINARQALLENPLEWPQVLAMPYWGVEAGAYRPITLFSYALNFFLFGAGAWSFHLVNLILYAGIGYFLFLFLRKIFRLIPPTRRRFKFGRWKLTDIVAGLGAWLFLILPIHSEVVANITGRAELLALFFSLLALLEILKKNSNKWLSLAWLLLALGSKETALAVLPIVLLVLVAVAGRSGWRRRGDEVAPPRPILKTIFSKKILENFWFPACLSVFIYFSIRWLVLGIYFFSNTASFVENPLKFVSVAERVLTSLKIFGLYVGKTILPFNLCSDYSYNQIAIVNNFFDWGALSGLVILGGTVFSIFYFFRRRFGASLACAVLFFPYLIISNLIFPIGTIMGERLFFFSSAGIAILMAVGVAGFWEYLSKKKIWRALAGGVALLLVLFYLGASFVRGLDWLSEERLFLSAGECAPRSVLSQSNLATVYFYRGDYKKVEEIILDSYTIYDKYTVANNNLGLAYWKMGEWDKAKEQYFKALRTYPPYAGIYENLVLFYTSQGDEEAAEKWEKIWRR